MKRFISLLLALTLVFGFEVVSAMESEIVKLPNALSGLFSLEAAALEASIASHAPSGTFDVALDASVTASSSYESGVSWGVDFINNGLLPNSTVKGGWSTSFADSTTDNTRMAWLVFDLECIYDLERITLFPYGSFPDSFSIQVSDDGVNYTTVTSVTGKINNTTALDLSLTGSSARFVMIYVTLRGCLDGNPVYFVQLGEVAIFGKNKVNTPDSTYVNSYAPDYCMNLAPESTVTASSSYESGGASWGLSYLTDTSTSKSTGWSTSGSDVNAETTPVSLDFDLGAYCDIKRMVLFPRGLFPKDYSIEISTDGVSYTPVFSSSGNPTEPSSPVVIDLPNAYNMASYVRVCVTRRNIGSENIYYVQLAEIALFGIKRAINASFSKEALLLNVGDTQQLTYDLKCKHVYEDLGLSCSWSSLDSSVATVDADGHVTAVSAGETSLALTESVTDSALLLPVTVETEIAMANDRFMLSVFCPPINTLMTDEQYRLLGEAGITLINNAYNVTSKAGNIEMARLAYKHGMQIIVGDSRILTDRAAVTPTLAQELVNDYSGIPGIGGYYLIDEPRNPNEYVYSYNSLKQASPESYVHLNFLPGYVYKSYEQYEYQLDDFANLTYNQDYLMFDIYPFLYSGTTTYQRMFDSLNAIRKSGLKNNVKTSACIQTLGYGPIASETYYARIPTEAEIRYQDMASVAYGAKQLSYFTWTTPTSTAERFTSAIIDADGNTTERYEFVKSINEDIAVMGDTLYNLDAQEVYLNGSDTYGQDAVPSSFFVKSTSEYSAIFSFMKDKNNGRNYFMAVNNDIVNAVSIPLTFDSAITSIEVLDTDTGEWNSVALSGAYSATLAAGDGILIRLPAGYEYGGAGSTASANAALDARVTGESSIGTIYEGTTTLNSWYLSCLTDGYTYQSTDKGLNGWCSELADASYSTSVTTDLGNAMQITSIRLNAADAATGYSGYYPKAYTVEVSSDGTTWSTVATETNASTDTYIDYTLSQVTARYVKIGITQMNAIDGKYAAALSEIQVYTKASLGSITCVPDGLSGYYVYFQGRGETTAGIYAWSENGGQDDIEWMDAETGSWTIKGTTYNHRNYVSVANHNNEHGTYITHVYVNRGLTDVASLAATPFIFSTNLSFDVNYDDIPVNQIKNLDSIVSGNGMTAAYDATADTITLSGAPTASYNLGSTRNTIDCDIEVGDKIIFSVEKVSGSQENTNITIDYMNSAGGVPLGERRFFDVSMNGGSCTLDITSQELANAVAEYRIWVYKRTIAQTLTDCELRLKIEVIKGGTSTVFTPSGKTSAYGAAYGTLPVPVRSNATFLGWFTQAAGGTQITADTIVSAVGNSTLYAHWQEPLELHACTAYQSENDGYYAYFNATGFASAKFPTWTSNGGQDDIVWETGYEAGNYVVDQVSYKYRHKVLFSNHNNELGLYKTHVYVYNEDASVNVAREVTITPAFNIYYDVNDGESAINIMQSGATNTSGGITYTYDEATDIITLDGTLTASSLVLPAASFKKAGISFATGDKIRLNVETISGTASNVKFTVDVYDSYKSKIDGSRHFKDVAPSALYGEVTLDTATLAENADMCTVWIYYNGTGTQSFSNYQCRLKLEKAGSTSEAYTPSVTTVSAGAANTALKSVSRTGYTFDDWYTEKVGGTLVTQATINAITSQQVIYAHWTANTYTLTFNANGGNSGASGKSVVYGEAYGELPTPSRTGYSFIGWNTSSDGTGTAITAADTVQITADTQLWAQWSANSYSITYRDLGGADFSGTLASALPTSHTYAAETALISPFKTGFTFGGWYTDASCEGTALTTLGAQDYTDDITLYAKWDKCDISFSDARIKLNDSKRTLSIGDEILDSFEKYISLTKECTIERTEAQAGFGTGSEIDIYCNGSLVYSFNVVVPGDIDGNGVVTGADVSAVSGYIAGTVQLGELQLMAADCNEDKVIDSNDIALMEQMRYFTVTFNGEYSYSESIRFGNRISVPVCEDENYEYVMYIGTEKYDMSKTITEDVAITINKREKLLLKSTTSKLYVNNTATITAEFAASKETAEVSWKSSNPNIAQINENGVVTGKRNGNVIITAKTLDGEYEVTYTLQILPTNATVSIFNYGNSYTQKLNWWKSYSTATMSLGYLTYNCSNAVKYVWSSSSSRVKIDQDGNITNTGSFSRSATITLTAYDANNIIIAKSSVKVSFYKFSWQKNRLQSQSIVSDNVLQQNASVQELESYDNAADAPFAELVMSFVSYFFDVFKSMIFLNS